MCLLLSHSLFEYLRFIELFVKFECHNAEHALPNGSKFVADDCLVFAIRDYNLDSEV
jgi:hypothetical protein